MVLGKKNYLIISDGQHGYYVKVGHPNITREYGYLCIDGKVRHWRTIQKLKKHNDTQFFLWPTHARAQMFVDVCLATKNRPILIPAYIQGHYRTPEDKVRALQYGLKSNSKILRHIVTRMVKQMIEDGDLQLKEDDQ